MGGLVTVLLFLFVVLLLKPFLEDPRSDKVIERFFVVLGWITAPIWFPIAWLVQTRSDRKQREARAVRAKPEIREKLRMRLDQFKEQGGRCPMFALDWDAKLARYDVFWSSLLYDIADKELDKTCAAILAEYKRNITSRNKMGREEAVNKFIGALERYYASMN